MPTCRGSWYIVVTLSAKYAFKAFYKIRVSQSIASNHMRMTRVVVLHRKFKLQLISRSGKKKWGVPSVAQSTWLQMVLIRFQRTLYSYRSICKHNNRSNLLVHPRLVLHFNLKNLLKTIHENKSNKQLSLNNNNNNLCSLQIRSKYARFITKNWRHFVKCVSRLYVSIVLFSRIYINSMRFYQSQKLLNFK